jgi:hypothetical protein
MVAATKVDCGRTVTVARPIPGRGTGGTERGSRRTASLLVIDDDSRVRTVVCWQLEAEGYLVREAVGGGRRDLRRAGCAEVAVRHPGSRHGAAGLLCSAALFWD